MAGYPVHLSAAAYGNIAAMVRDSWINNTEPQLRRRVDSIVEDVGRSRGRWGGLGGGQRGASGGRGGWNPARRDSSSGGRGGNSYFGGGGRRYNPY
jgi:hypothetical protein